ncbi:potassium-transporting ATPase subunit F [Staphylococcus saccharolyticus]|nr:potassium-transporting ATPase subunit F [Staphylococcus saccharolyticus]TAA99525.1 potassium-transporting ATPase subunit F [Staphylococcus saccharolyticus]TAB00699.1 potassium-transporting ATPase subunit F [Staphylococcus saccharolyticus]TAB02645.1 potassium-transporting ATPase subunit F [Staphylococcus saccharolyticus]
MTILLALINIGLIVFSFYALIKSEKF